MPDWLPRRAHIPRNRKRPRGTSFEIHLGLRKLWDPTAYLMRSPANAAAILEAVEELDRWREQRDAPLRALRDLIDAGEREAALDLVDDLLDHRPPEYEPIKTRARPLLARS